MAGSIVHVEMPADDDSRATGFYADLFGWTWNTAEMPGLAYHMNEPASGPVTAVYKGDEGTRGPIIYFDSDDIAADVARVRELGGEAGDQQPIPGVGWFARCRDTEGNPFSLFQGDESAAPPGA